MLLRKFKERRKRKKAAEMGKGSSGSMKSTRAEKKFDKKGTTKLTQRGRRKQIGASKKTKVSKGAVSVVKTKGGEYVKYKKDSKAAGSFRSAFKSKCSGGAKGFTWQGRKYSCAKK